MALAILLAVDGVAAHPNHGAPDLTEVPIEDLLALQVTSASRFEQKVSEAPSAVRVITAAEIRDFGWRTLDEALASLPGLYTSYDRSYAYLGTRGVLRPGDYNTRFLLLVNGNRINDPVYDQAAIGSDFVLDMDLIDRIEYVPGSGSSAYGSNAFFGVINVITRTGADYPDAEARVELGSDGRRGLAARYGYQGANGDLLLAASGFSVAGADLYFPEYDSPDSNGGVANGLDDNRSRRFLLTGTWDAFTLSAMHAVRSKGDPAASFQQLFNDPRSNNRDARTLLDVAYQAIHTPTLEVTAHVFGGRYAYDGVFAYQPLPGATNFDETRASWAGFGVHALMTGWERHKLVVGFDGQYDFQREFLNYDSPPDTPLLHERSKNYRAGVFVEDEFALREHLLVNAGLRLDHDGVTGSHANPRLALIYDAGHGSNVKAIVGTAYRSPNFYETDYVADSTDDVAGDLDAEHIATRELVLTRRLGQRTTFTGSLFDYELGDLIEAGDDAISFSNRGRISTRGVELALDHVWEGGAIVRASYSYAKAHDVDADDELENSPHHLAKVNFSTPIPRTALRAGVEGRYVSERTGISGPVDAYTLFNTTVTWVSNDSRIELSATLHNVLDETYAEPAGPAYLQNAIVQDGRAHLLRLIYRF